MGDRSANDGDGESSPATFMSQEFPIGQAILASNYTSLAVGQYDTQANNFDGNNDSEAESDTNFWTCVLHATFDGWQPCFSGREEQPRPHAKGIVPGRSYSLAPVSGVAWFRVFGIDLRASSCSMEKGTKRQYRFTLKDAPRIRVCVPSLASSDMQLACNPLLFTVLFVRVSRAYAPSCVENWKSQTPLYYDFRSQCNSIPPADPSKQPILDVFPNRACYLLLASCARAQFWPENVAESIGSLTWKTYKQALRCMQRSMRPTSNIARTMATCLAKQKVDNGDDGTMAIVPCNVSAKFLKTKQARGTQGAIDNRHWTVACTTAASWARLYYPTLHKLDEEDTALLYKASALVGAPNTLLLAKIFDTTQSILCSKRWTKNHTTLLSCVLMTLPEALVLPENWHLVSRCILNTDADHDDRTCTLADITWPHGPLQFRSQAMCQERISFIMEASTIFLQDMDESMKPLWLQARQALRRAFSDGTMTTDAFNKAYQESMRLPRAEIGAAESDKTSAQHAVFGIFDDAWGAFSAKDRKSVAHVLAALNDPWRRVHSRAMYIDAIHAHVSNDLGYTQTPVSHAGTLGLGNVHIERVINPMWYINSRTAPNNDSSKDNGEVVYEIKRKACVISGAAEATRWWLARLISVHCRMGTLAVAHFPSQMACILKQVKLWASALTRGDDDVSKDAVTLVVCPNPALADYVCETWPSEPSILVVSMDTLFLSHATTERSPVPLVSAATGAIVVMWANYFGIEHWVHLLELFTGIHRTELGYVGQDQETWWPYRRRKGSDSQLPVLSVTDPFVSERPVAIDSRTSHRQNHYGTENVAWQLVHCERHIWPRINLIPKITKGAKLLDSDKIDGVSSCTAPLAAGIVFDEMQQLYHEHALLHPYGSETPLIDKKILRSSCVQKLRFFLGNLRAGRYTTIDRPNQFRSMQEPPELHVHTGTRLYQTWKDYRNATNAIVHCVDTGEILAKPAPSLFEMLYNGMNYTNVPDQDNNASDSSGKSQDILASVLQDMCHGHKKKKKYYGKKKYKQDCERLIHMAEQNAANGTLCTCGSNDPYLSCKCMFGPVVFDGPWSIHCKSTIDARCAFFETFRQQMEEMDDGYFYNPVTDLLHQLHDQCPSRIAWAWHGIRSCSECMGEDHDEINRNSCITARGGAYDGSVRLEISNHVVQVSHSKSPIRSDMFSGPPLAHVDVTIAPNTSINRFLHACSFSSGSISIRCPELSTTTTDVSENGGDDVLAQNKSIIDKALCQISGAVHTVPADGLWLDQIFTDMHRNNRRAAKTKSSNKRSTTNHGEDAFAKRMCV